MNKFLDEIYDNAKVLIDKTSEKAEEFVGRSKTQIEIYKLRAQLRQCYTLLGIRVYNKAKSEEGLDKVMEMRISEITALRKKIDELKEQVELIGFYKKCKNCGSYNDKEDEICLNCGASLKPYHKTVYSVNFDKNEDKE